MAARDNRRTEAMPNPPAPTSDAVAAPLAGSLTATPLGALVQRAPVTLPPSASIAEAARTMREQGVSSLLLIEQGALFGIVTDRDLRNRVLAAGLDPAREVWEIATAAPLTMQASRPAIEALLAMTRHHVHHLPVLDGTRLVGLVSATDLAEQQSAHAVYLADAVRRQRDLDGLVATAARVERLQRALVDAHASAQATGQVVTAIADAIAVRLLEFAEARLGPPPVEYTWVAAGSQARGEQTARSDQDNCLVLDDAYDAARHGTYFEALATQVNDGLAACGYLLCPGGIMARNPAWRLPASGWRAQFVRWTARPEPEALMWACVFFDMRRVHGSAGLLDGLRHEVLQRTRGNRLFLAHLVGNALAHRPPLNWRGGIARTEHDGVKDTVDLKMGGLAPVIELARALALEVGDAAVNTQDRLAIAAGSGELAEGDARDLGVAFEWIATLRLRHQAAQAARGEPAHNFLPLARLSRFERGQLKEAFRVVQSLQSAMAQRYR